MGSISDRQTGTCTQLPKKGGNMSSLPPCAGHQEHNGVGGKGWHSEARHPDCLHLLYALQGLAAARLG